MTLKDYADSSGWFWPVFYIGIGYAQAAIIVTTFYFVISIRLKIKAGAIRKTLGELIIIMLSMPSIISIFSLMNAMRLIHDKDYPAGVIFGVASLAITIFAAIYFGPKIK